MRTVVAFLAMWVVGCGGRVAHDQPWAEQQIALPTGGEAGAGGEGGGEATTSSSSTSSTTEEDCPAGCDDGNDCTEDACVDGVCAQFGADDPDPCTSAAGNAGVCAWSACVLTDCGQSETTDGEKCFYEGGVGVCEDGVCGGPCSTDEDCDDGNDCTEDYCLGSGACSNPEDTLHSVCGDGGNCWVGECCEGCFDLAAGACVAECAAGTCSSLGACQ